MSSAVMAAMREMMLELSAHGRSGGPITREGKSRIKFIVAVEICNENHPGEGGKGTKSGNGRNPHANGQRRKEAKSTWRPIRGEINRQHPGKQVSKIIRHMIELTHLDL
jgi:hypothetical protein